MAQYLVLRPFSSYGRYFAKGDIVDESLIRSPYLRRSEGKITPAVSSAQTPEVEAIEVETPAPSIEDDINKEEGAQTKEKKPLFAFTQPSK